MALRLALLLALAACSDGYPTDDEPAHDLASFSQAELLHALNELGAPRWHYTLAPGCRLTAEVRNGETRQHSAPLLGAAIEARVDDGKQFRITLLGEQGAVPVFATPKWTDSVQAESLLAYLERSCDAPREPAR